MTEITKEAIRDLKTVSSEMRHRVDQLDESIQMIEKCGQKPDYNLRALIEVYFSVRGLEREVDIGILDRKEYDAWNKLLRTCTESP